MKSLSKGKVWLLAAGQTLFIPQGRVLLGVFTVIGAITALATIGSGGDGYRAVAGVSCGLALVGGIILLFYNEKKINAVINSD